MSTRLYICRAATVKERMEIGGDGVIDLFRGEGMEEFKRKVANAVDETIDGANLFKEGMGSIEIGEIDRICRGRFRKDKGMGSFFFEKFCESGADATCSTGDGIGFSFY